MASPSVLLTWYWRDKKRRDDQANALEAHRLATETAFSARFKSAAELLASTDQMTRINGLETLWDIALQSEVHRPAISRTLAAFVRTRAPAQPEGIGSEDSGGPPRSLIDDSQARKHAAPKRPTADIQTALMLLGAAKWALPDWGREHVDLIETNLEGARLDGYTLHNVLLVEAQVKGASLRGTLLSGSDLLGADLERARLNEAHLEDAHLNHANLQRANLGGAHLDRAYLEDAHLEDARLGNADLGGAHLERAHLARANLECTRLEDANLDGASFDGANLVGALYDVSTTKFSEYFNPEARGMIPIEARKESGAEPIELSDKSDANSVLANVATRRSAQHRLFEALGSSKPRSLAGSISAGSFDARHEPCAAPFSYLTVGGW